MAGVRLYALYLFASLFSGRGHTKCGRVRRSSVLTLCRMGRMNRADRVIPRDNKHGILFYLLPQLLHIDCTHWLAPHLERQDGKDALASYAVFFSESLNAPPAHAKFQLQ